MRLTNRTMNSVKKYVFVVENQLQTQSFLQSSFSIKEFFKKNIRKTVTSTQGAA